MSSRRTFGKGRPVLRKKEESGWMDFLSNRFKWDQSDFLLRFSNSSRLSVGASRDALWFLAKLSQKSVRSEAKTSSPLMKSP